MNTKGFELSWYNNTIKRFRDTEKTATKILALEVVLYLESRDSNSFLKYVTKRRGREKEVAKQDVQQSHKTKIGLYCSVRQQMMKPQKQNRLKPTFNSALQAISSGFDIDETFKR